MAKCTLFLQCKESLRAGRPAVCHALGVKQYPEISAKPTSERQLAILDNQAGRSIWISACFTSLACSRRFVRARRLRRLAGEWSAGEQDSREFQSEAEYLEALEADADLPKGFGIASSSLTFVPEEAQEMGELPMRITVIHVDEPSDMVAAVFTQNAFPGAPVRVGRRRLSEREHLQAIVVNNKISNVSPPDADGGVAASEELCTELAKKLKLPGATAVLPSSTGVIGWRLPVMEMVQALPSSEMLKKGSAVPAARGIMTTDRYPKLSAKTFDGGARLVGIAKGAGMIEPNMATMLSFLMTDASFDRAELQKMLEECVATSFNAISVDGDESTSDTVVLISSGQATEEVSKEAFKAALQEVCCDLAAQVVRNGEGTQHVIRVSISGADTDDTAKRIGKAVVNGPLFKSAVAGNDPNVGRLIGKVGQALGAAGAQMAQDCVCKIGGETIFEKGQFRLDTAKEKRLSSHLKFAEAD